MFAEGLSKLSLLRPLRRIVLPILERFNPGDIRIRHHYTGQRLLVHSYRHKGYWFHGRRREQETMQFFERVLRPGDTVVEIGGHIGYVTMWFAELVGETGRVVVFEPGQNNLPYLRANVGELPMVEIVEAAVSDRDGAATFFEEELTGQNNSLVGDYERFEQNRRSAFSKQSYHGREVETVRLDTFLRQPLLRPDLVKIDIEGAEYMALNGAAGVLADELPVLMVEVTRNCDDVYLLLTGLGYRLFTPAGQPLSNAQSVQDNVCALHPVKHRDRLPDWIAGDGRAAA